MSGSATAVTESVTEWYFPPDRWPRSNLQMLRDSAAPKLKTVGLPVWGCITQMINAINSRITRSYKIN